ncbi:MAG: mechanosensitive ion channel [Alphaproteobacteria bacterium]|nr:MAG: mechanosensitive ion channel [Alphaproteobacteria bacterium]
MTLPIEATEEPTADPALAVPVPEATPSSKPTQPMEAAEGLKEAVSAKSKAAGSLVDTLDSWALNFGHVRFSLWDGIVSLGVILLVMLAAWAISRISGRLVRRASRLDDTQRLLTQKILTIVIWAGAFFVGIDLLGIDLTALAVFSGAFGLAIGFGLQKTFGNLIAGIILLMDKSIKPGDVISVTDAAGNEGFGQIRKIGIRAISVVTRDKTEYLIPNENLMINQVVNWSYSSRDVRVKAPVGVAYGSDLELVEKLLMQAAQDTPRVLTFPEPRILLIGFGESSVDFEIRFWIDDPEEGLSNIRSDVLKRVWRLFQDNGVEIPFPQRDLNLRTNKQFDRLIEALSTRELSQ